MCSCDIRMSCFQGIIPQHWGCCAFGCVRLWPNMEIMWCFTTGRLINVQHNILQHRNGSSRAPGWDFPILWQSVWNTECHLVFNVLMVFEWTFTVVCIFRFSFISQTPVIKLSRIKQRLNDFQQTKYLALCLEPPQNLQLHVKIDA